MHQGEVGQEHECVHPAPQEAQAFQDKAPLSRGAAAGADGYRTSFSFTALNFEAGVPPVGA
jgi:hypothetical protein